jgi:(p)ppGpp synthase/HD superfamily hydrolase
MNIVEHARIFATAAHAAIGQKRKYTGEPYIVHPIEVMNIVKTVNHTEEMLATALLHDVLEDTKVTYGDLHDEFGLKIADMVLWMTDISKPEDGNRETRKALDRQHIAAAPADIHTIKLADLIANTRSILAFDPNFARVYLKEKKMLIDVMVRGDQSLREIAIKQINDANF